MADLAATFVRSLREALARVALQPDATVVSQVSADYVRVELRQGDLVLAAGTVHRAGVPATTRQVELPFEAPATTRQVELPLPAPSDANELVELIMDDDQGTFEGLDLFDATTVIAWTWAGKRGARDEYLRTIVPRDVAAELLRRSKGRISQERSGATAKGLPSHVLTIGGDVVTEEAGPRKILGVVGVSEGTEGSPGLVVEMPEGPRVAWVDALDLKGGAVVAYPSLAYVVEWSGGRWTARRHEEPPPRPLPTMKPKKAPKPKASAVAKVGEASEVESHRAQKHDCDAAKLRHPNTPCVAWVDTGAVQTETRPKGTTEAAWVEHVRELAALWGTVRVYSRKGECTWDSRDGAR